MLGSAAFLRLLSGVKSVESALKVYLAARVVASNPQAFPSNDQPGAVTALLSFCIPDYGVMFRCRVVTGLRELSYTAAVTALRFVEKSMSEAGQTERIELLTDDPAFYFSATRAKDGGERDDLLSQYIRRFHVDFQLISRSANQARRTSHTLPEHPLDTSPKLKLKKDLSQKSGKMMPFQDGIDL